MEEYLQALEQGLAEKALSFWSQDSPFLVTVKKEFEDGLHPKRFDVTGAEAVALASERAAVGLSVRMTGAQGVSNKQWWVWLFVAEKDDWRLWSQISDETQFVRALFGAKKDERDALLQVGGDLVSLKLVRELQVEAKNLFRRAEYDQSATAYRVSQTLAERLQDLSGIASALRGLANIESRKGHLLSALDKYKMALKLDRNIGNRKGIASTLNNLGVAYRSSGEYLQAIKHYEESLEIKRQLRDQQGIANTLNNLGVAYELKGEYGTAMQHYKKSLEMKETLDLTGGIANTLRNIAALQHFQGDFENARRNFRRSLDYYEDIDDKHGILAAMVGMGNVYISQGNYLPALRLLQRGLKLSESLEELSSRPTILNNVGLIHGLLGNYIQALEFYRKSLKLSEKAGDRVGVASICSSIGNMHLMQGDQAQAEAYMVKSLELSRRLGDKLGMATSVNSMGLIYWRQQNYDKAKQLYQQSLNTMRQLNNLEGTSEVLSNLALVHLAEGEFDESGRLATQAATAAREVGSPERLWRALTTAGKSYMARGEFRQARQILDEAIASIEGLRLEAVGGARDQQRFFENKVSPYYAMVNLLIREKPIEAFLYAERAKGRVLLDVLRYGRPSITKAMTQEEIERDRTLRAQLMSLNARISLEQEQIEPKKSKLQALRDERKLARLAYEAFNQTLYVSHPKLKIQRGEPTPLEFDQIASILPDNETALLEFVLSEKDSSLFVLTSSGGEPSQGGSKTTLVHYPLAVPPAELAAKVQAFRQSLEQRDLDFHLSARELHQLLLKPADAQLRGKQLLVIVPDGVLWELPFQALETERGYLIKEVALFYTPSLSILREMSQRAKRCLPAGTPTLLAMGNPALSGKTIDLVRAVQRGQQLGPLPEAEQEVKAIAELFPPERRRIYLGAAARERVVKAEARGFDILHFATHGTLDDSNPMYSRLLFAREPQGDQEDGMLEAWEILKMELSADLAVLSACQTAGGRVGNGEGVIGMSWALFVAGCRSAVVSQWKVDSASTTQMMVDFHRALGDGARRSSKAAALRKASLKLLQVDAYRHPFYWAGFILVGDGF